MFSFSSIGSDVNEFEQLPLYRNTHMPVTIVTSAIPCTAIQGVTDSFPPYWLRNLYPLLLRNPIVTLRNVSYCLV